MIDSARTNDELPSDESRLGAGVHGQRGTPKLLTAKELAAEIKVDPSQIYRLVKAKQIISYDFASGQRFLLEEVLAMARERGLDRTNKVERAHREKDRAAIRRIG